MKIALIDNYDSFVYNLRHHLLSLGAQVSVFRNDGYQLADLREFDKLVFSPGPGVPSESGLLLDTIRHYAGQKPMLGVCLGEQAIAECFGGTLTNLSQVCHGIQSEIRLTGSDYIFDGLGPTIRVGRYHSWVVCPHSLPSSLRVTALSSDGHIMALRHADFDIHGIQFHPESILTPCGLTILSNFLSHNQR